MSASGRLNAIVEADRTLDLLNIPKDQPVDVFAAINTLGLEWAIVDLDGLLGAMLPHGQGGILITSQRGPRVQRYTAAHEIGHWMLHRPDPAVDAEAEIFFTPSSERERQAQLFAAYFVMPPPLVDEIVTRYDLRHGPVTPEHLYLASRDMRVSYEAAARRLVTHKVIKDHDLPPLLNVSRLDAMRRAFGGRRPADGNADLWFAAQQQRMEVNEHDELIVRLPENRASGWRWLNIKQLAERDRRTQGARPYVPHNHTGGTPVPAERKLRKPADIRAALDLLPHTELTSDSRNDVHVGEFTVIVDVFDSPGLPKTTHELVQRRRQTASSALYDTEVQAPRVGGTGQRTMVLRCNQPGETTFQLEYTHAYEPNTPPALTYRLMLEVLPTPATAYRSIRLDAVDLDLRLDGDPDDDAVYSVVGA